MNQAKNEAEWVFTERKPGFLPFIFSVSRHKHHRNQPVLSRVGVCWETLLESDIPVELLNPIFKTELAFLHEKFPNLRINGQKKINLRNCCNYVAPEGAWVGKMSYNMDSFVHELIPRMNRLLAAGVLSPWIATQLLKGIVATFAQRYQKSRAYWLASQLVDGSIRTFKNILENQAKPWKHENFFSFIFNYYQQLFTLGNYEISVSHKLVDFGLPLTFLKSYFLHGNNVYARYSLWEWCIGRQDFFGKRFYAYWRQRGYVHSEIADFENTVLPYLGPPEDEWEVPENSDVQCQYPVMYPLSPSLLILGTPVFLSPIIAGQSQPTLICRIQPQCSPVLLLLLPSTSTDETIPPNESQGRVTHIGDKKSEDVSPPQGISQQLKKSLRIGNFSKNNQGMLVKGSSLENRKFNSTSPTLQAVN